MPSIVNTERTGQVFLRNFDQGIAETLGADIRVRTVNEQPKQSYYVDIPGVGVDIPIIMVSPEVIFEQVYLPSIVLRRDEPTFAANRWPSISSGYRMPVGEAVSVGGVNGRRRLEAQPVPYPYDITYTLEGFTRLRNQSTRLLDFVLRVYKPYGKVFVLDSVGDRRSYECFMEGIASLDQVTDAADRECGFGVTLRVAGELDHVDAYDSPSVTSAPQVNMSILTNQ